MKTYRFSILYSLWPAVILLAGLIVAMSITSAHALPVEPEGPAEPEAMASPNTPADTPGAIQGHLYPPTGTLQVPIVGGWIDIFDEQGDPWMGMATDENGYFEITNLPPGFYFLTGYPPEGTPYAADLPMPVEVFPGEWSSVTVRLDFVRISGYVKDCEAVPELRIEGAFVQAYDEFVEQWAETDANGEFKLGGLEEGHTYHLQAHPPDDSEYAPLPPITVTVPFTQAVLELCIPPTNVIGLVQDYTGAPVPGAGVALHNDDHWFETAADETGSFLFRGIPPGEFWIEAAPPWDVQGLLSSEPFTLFVEFPTSTVDAGVIVLPRAFKTAVGHVVNAETGAGVPDALVRGNRLDDSGYAETATDASGAFTLSLAGGEWHLGTEPLDWAAEWLFPGPPEWIVFHEAMTVPETITVNLEVIPTNAFVKGHIVSPGGAPCAGDPPHEDFWIELRNDEFVRGVGLTPDYNFMIPIPAGWYELVIHLWHHHAQGPRPIPVFVGPGQTLDLGEIELLAKTARIAGWVHDRYGNGVPEVPVFAWQPEGGGWGWAETGASGWYTMHVVPGEWFVEPIPRPDQPFVFRQEPKLVRVAPHGLVFPINFVLTKVDAHIEGAAVDAHSGGRIWGLDGWAWSERYVSTDTLEFFSEAPMWDGGFELKVKGGAWYNVGVAVPPHAPYVSGGAGPLRIEPGEWLTTMVPLLPKNAWFEGQLVNALDGTPAFGAWAEIFGHDEHGHWVHGAANPEMAWYELGVVSGTWHLDFWVDPESGYVAGPQPPPMTIAAETGQRLDLEVWPIDAWIEGWVLAPDGTGIEGAFVFAEGDSPFVGYFETHAETDPTGFFKLRVPEGVYLVGTGLPRERLEENGWLNPPPIEGVYAAAPHPATGLELRFRKLDGEIHGTIAFTPTANVTPTHSAFVWGWAESGEWTEGEAQVVSGTNTFTYTLRVVSDTIWHIGAVYEDWDSGVFYESPEAVVPVPPTPPPVAQAFQNLTLDGPWSLPQPFIISFDASQMQTILMPDGIELTIPGGALAKEGTVTLFIFPTREIRPEQGQEIIGAGYEIWAIDGNGKEITQFNKDVFVTIPYPDDATLAAKGISEQLLVPVYYSTLLGHWILADSYVLDMDNNEITLQIDHFTRFGALSKAEPATIELTDLEIDGPSSGVTDMGYTFTASIVPITATGLTPITYTWQATDQVSVTAGSVATHSTSFTWTTPGRKIITATATNTAYTVSDTHVITVSEACIEVESVTLSQVTSDPLYVGDPVDFGATILPNNANTPYSYSIDYDDGTTPITSTDGTLLLPLSHTFNSTGTFDVLIKVWNCALSASEAVTGTARVFVGVEKYMIYLPLALNDY